MHARTLGSTVVRPMPNDDLPAPSRSPLRPWRRTSTTCSVPGYRHRMHEVAQSAGKTYKSTERSRKSDSAIQVLMDPADTLH